MVDTTLSLLTNRIIEIVENLGLHTYLKVFADEDSILILADDERRVAELWLLDAANVNWTVHVHSTGETQMGIGTVADVCDALEIALMLAFYEELTILLAN